MTECKNSPTGEHEYEIEKTSCIGCGTHKDEVCKYCHLPKTLLAISI